MPIIELSHIYKTYNMGGTEVHASADINISVEAGEFLIIMGPSGSGKSTMMNIIGCLDRPSSGSYILDGLEVSKLDDDELAYIRNQKIGFVFQKFHLLPSMSAKENVELPMIYSGVKSSYRDKTSKDSLESVGLEGRIHHNPNELSGGQMQRVAIARSLVNKPAIILADEPTGNLDTKSGKEIMALFQDLHRDGRTIVLITHNPEMARYGTRVIKLQDGEIVSDEKLKDSERILLESKNGNNGLLKEKVKSRGKMDILQSFKVAWNALKANKMRSLLTMLGIIIGVCAVIVMTSIGEGTKYNVTQQIYSMGTNLIYLTRAQDANVIGRSTDAAVKRITSKDVEAIEEKCTLVVGVAPEVSRSLVARYRSNSWQTTLVGTTPDYVRVKNYTIDTGRFFSNEEVKGRNPVCILGSEVAKRLFGKEDNIIGKTVKVTTASSNAGMRLTVIGIFKSKGKTFGQDNDNQIFTPIDTVQYRLFNTPYVQVVYLEAASADMVKYAIQDITRVILPLHNNDPNNFTIDTQEEILESVGKTMAAFTFMLAGIAFISLLVGGIGIMNIMLVSVTERTREIGLRKAIGARKKDILLQFLIESLVLGITGGVIGILVGLGLSKVYTIIAASSALGFLSKTFVSVDSILLSFSFSAIVGIFFGLYPARKAASLDPIEALRYE